MELQGVTQAPGPSYRGAPTLLHGTPMHRPHRLAVVALLLVFDFLTGNWDRWSGANVPMDAQGHVRGSVHGDVPGGGVTGGRTPDDAAPGTADHRQQGGGHEEKWRLWMWHGRAFLPAMEGMLGVRMPDSGSVR